MNQKFVGFDQKQHLVLHYDSTGSESVWVASEPTTEEMLVSSENKSKKKKKKKKTKKKAKKKVDKPKEPVANISTKPTDITRVAIKTDSRGLSLSSFSYSPHTVTRSSPPTAKRKRTGQAENLSSRKQSRLETSARSSFQVNFHRQVGYCLSDSLLKPRKLRLVMLQPVDTLVFHS